MGLVLARWRSGLVGALLLTVLFGWMTAFLAAVSVDVLREGAPVTVVAFNGIIRGTSVAVLFVVAAPLI